MGISLVTMRANVLRDLGVDATDLDASGSANLDLLINKSWWQIMDEFDFREKEDSCEFDTVAGTRDYDLTTEISASAAVTFDALRSAYIVDPNDSRHIPLIEWGIRQYESNYVDDSDEEAMPTNYVREGGNLRLWATPDDVYTIGVYYLKVLSDVAAGGPDIPQSWHEIIELGAIWRGHTIFRDFTSAQQVQKVQTKLILSAKTTRAAEDSNLKMAGVEVPTRPTARRY